jgi:hypothetical protein
LVKTILLGSRFKVQGSRFKVQGFKKINAKLKFKSKNTPACRQAGSKIG